MPTCQKCNETWSWKQTLNKSLTFKRALICPSCGEKQYISLRTRKRTAAIVFIAPFLSLLNSYFGSHLMLLFILLGYLTLFIVIYPFYLELSNKEEPLF
ncbi:TIGR04104 family putative zinc finger protein [Bacillus sp. JJ1566]|uniref:TIGR04104 family putative zinc finger protein n=1 Tax=Bacillus sp. JJ1566 TaxID=3122961 RepID=UPI003F68B34B